MQYIGEKVSKDLSCSRVTFFSKLREPTLFPTQPIRKGCGLLRSMLISARVVSRRILVTRSKRAFGNVSVTFHCMGSIVGRFEVGAAQEKVLRLQLS